MRTLLHAFFVTLVLSQPLIAQWTHTAGPPGMTTNCFLESGGRLFIGTEMKGVHSSLDNGATWTPSNNGIENEWVMSLADDGTYLFAGTLGHGVFRSADLGLSWESANAGIQTVAVKCLLNAAGYLWAGAIGGIWRSPDQGQSWQDASGGALTFAFIFTMVYRAPRLEVEADNYLYYTEDLGDNWSIDQGSTSFYVIKHFLQQGDTVLAAVDNHVFRTTDGLQNWGSVIDVDPDESIRIAGLARQGDTIYAGHQYGVFRSTNWGQSWTNIPSTGLRSGNRQTNHFTISNGVFLLAFEEIGIYRSLDQGSTWVGSLDGLGAHSGIDNCITVAGDKVISGTHSNGVWRSPDDGATWNRIGTPDPLDPLSNAIVFATLRPEPGIILAGTCGYNDGLYRSEDNGGSWTHITDGLPSEVGTGFVCINNLVRTGDNIVAATTEGVYYSTDLGISWNPTTISGPSTYAAGLAANGTVACVGISSGAPTGIYRSTNSGENWTLVGGVLDVVSVASDGVDHFYAGSFSGNYRSTNNGLQWNPVSGIPPDVGGYAAIAIGMHVFIGNDEGVWHSDDYGANFEPASEGMDPGMNHTVQGFGANDTYLFAGLHRNGIWRRALSDFDITTGISNTAAEVNELRAWPDPASSHVSMEITLKHPERVSLTIHDATGRTVRTILDNILIAGIQRSDLAIADLAPGPYIVRLSTPEHSVARSLRIVR